MISCDECGEWYHQSCIRLSVDSNLRAITQVLIYFGPVENVAIEYCHGCGYNLIVTCTLQTIIFMTMDAKNVMLLEGP